VDTKTEGEEEEVIRDTTRGTTIDTRPRNNTGEEGTAAERDTIKIRRRIEEDTTEEEEEEEGTTDSNNRPRTTRGTMKGTIPGTRR